MGDDWFEDFVNHDGRLSSALHIRLDMENGEISLEHAHSDPKPTALRRILLSMQRIKCLYLDTLIASESLVKYDAIKERLQLAHQF